MKMRNHLLMLLLSLLPFQSFGSVSNSPFEELAHPLCPRANVTIRCTVHVPSDVDLAQGAPDTRWTYVNGSQTERPCTLTATTPYDNCGLGKAELVDRENEVNGIYTSEFQFYADKNWDGVEIMCNSFETERWGQVNVIGPQLAPNITKGEIFVNADQDQSNVTVTISLDHEDFANISRFVITTNPLTRSNSSKVIRPGENGFQSRVYKFNLTLPTNETYNLIARADNCDDRQHGLPSKPLQIVLRAPEAVKSCNVTVVYNKSTTVEVHFNLLAPRKGGNAGSLPSALIDLQSQFKHYWVSSAIRDEAVGNMTYYIAELDCDERESKGTRITDEELQCTGDKCSYLRDTDVDVNGIAIYAENIIGSGATTNCTSQKIGVPNNLLDVSLELKRGKATCTFKSTWRASRCILSLSDGSQYSSDACDDENTNTLTIEFPRVRPRPGVMFSYNISATDGQLTVIIMRDMLVVSDGSLSMERIIRISTTSCIVGAILIAVVVVVVVVVCVMLKKSQRAKLLKKSQRAESDGGGDDEPEERDGPAHENETGEDLTLNDLDTGPATANDEEPELSSPRLATDGGDSDSDEGHKKGDLRRRALRSKAKESPQ